MKAVEWELYWTFKCDESHSRLLIRKTLRDIQNVFRECSSLVLIVLKREVKCFVFVNIKIKLGLSLLTKRHRFFSVIICVLRDKSTFHLFHTI